MTRLAAVLLTPVFSALLMRSQEPTPQPRYSRYMRSVTVHSNASGQACAVLDGAIFAHAARQSADDLRLYDAQGAEHPFIVTESGSARFGDERAEVKNAGTRDGDVVFDLVMPNRPYTQVQLDVAAKDFLATAIVTGFNAGEAPVQLGTFTLFDFTSRQLSRSTVLALQESTFHILHVLLHVRSSSGSGAKAFNPAMVQGATVPPSREAQTIYTTISTASVFTRGVRESVATVHVPAHVPVERFTFEVDPSFQKDYLRNVSITARPDGAQDASSVETISGQIAHTTLPATFGASVTGESLSELSIDAVLGADLRKGATVQIAVANSDDAPLPLRAVMLQMRERRICFDVAPAANSYTLRYGDDGLGPPAYDYARSFVAARSPIRAMLGLEQTNPSFRNRSDALSHKEHFPQTLWLTLIATILLLGARATRGARRNR